MTYFSKFPLMIHESNGKETVVKDILRRARFISEYKPYTDLYTPYRISDGETPQSIAHSIYGAATYHWVVMLFNEIHDPYFDWPMSSHTLYDYCVDKYGEDNMYLVRHIEQDGNIIGEIKEFNKDIPWVAPENDGNHLAVSFYEYEESVNEAKRSIHIMRPELLGDFVSQFGEWISV